MIDTVKADLFRYTGKDYSLATLLKGFRSQGFRYMFFRRLREHYGNRHPVGMISRWLQRRYTYKYGFQIGGKIAPGFYIGHFGTIVVSSQAVIGKNCNIAHLVTVGAARGKRNGAPQLGDRVWIGTGAVLVGNITIGSDVMIAPNTYVNFDVPDHSLVLGNPGKIKPKQNPTQHYIKNQWV